MPRFKIAPSALADLDEIWTYIAESNEAAAVEIIRDITKKFDLLAEHREIGIKQDDLLVGMRMFPFKNYNIYYFPADDELEIYRILHSSRNAPDVLREIPDQ